MSTQTILDLSKDTKILIHLQILAAVDAITLQCFDPFLESSQRLALQIACQP